MSSIIGSLMATDGAGSAKQYVDDVFSTYLYTGNEATQNIVNGIDLAGEGGMVWIKARNETHSNYIFTPTNISLVTNTTSQAYGWSTRLSSMNNDGFTLGNNGGSNGSGINFTSWTFRKAPKFFDIVTYTGDGVAGREIAHEIGVAPGMIYVKRTDSAADWQVYHRSIANTGYMVLNSTDDKATGATRWNSTTATDSVFSLGTDTTVNASGATYVAYIFAHDPEEDGMIQCGSFTTDASGLATVSLGWEPQYLLVKNANTAEDWLVYDSMRGLVVGSNDSILKPNDTAAESTAQDIDLTADGFNVNALTVSDTYIYMAIRRLNKPPESGSEVFAVDAYNGTGSQSFTTNFPVDWFLSINRTKSIYSDNTVFSRLLPAYLKTNTTDAQSSFSVSVMPGFDSNNSIELNGSNATNASDHSYVGYAFRRTPGFFDVVCYTGNGVAGRAVNHNLGVVPEMIIVKNRNNTEVWAIYHSATGNTLRLKFDDTTGNVRSTWNNTTPTDTVFTLGTDSNSNDVSKTYVAYLFATLPGISKVGSYTGNGTNQTIDCGFATGASFLLIKRTDATGDWYLWDDVRGIIAANDPHLSLNTTAAEVTTDDSVDPHASGFIVNQVAATNINVTDATYIFLAIS